MNKPLTYADSGVDIDAADQALLANRKRCPFLGFAMNKPGGLTRADEPGGQ